MKIKQPLKIGLIIPSFFPAVVYGGPIFSTLYTCRELIKFDDLRLRVSTTNANMGSKLDVKVNEYIELEPKLFIKYYDELIIGKFSLSLFFNIWRDIKNSDIIHVQSIFNTPTPISLIAAKLFKKPTILSPRGSLGEWPLKNGSKFKNIWLSLLIRPFSTGVTWHVTSLQEKIEVLTLFPNAKVDIIPNGIDFTKFQSSSLLSRRQYVNKFLNLNFEPKKIIISMGRLQKKKGFDILINAVYEVLKIVPDVVCLIAGSDEGEKNELLCQIQKLNLTNNVFLIGQIQGQDKIDFLANSDLFCLPSYNENFGNVYLESLASGTPIVASKMTPWSDVENFNCGKWVENTVESNVQAILEMFEKDNNLMTENSRNLAMKYDWKYVASEFDSLYHSIVEIE
jgi:glycosyltransferase involved in cell wall biosynthesis